MINLDLMSSQLALFPMSEDQQYLMRKGTKVYPTSTTAITTTNVNSSATLTPTMTPLNHTSIGGGSTGANGGGGGDGSKTALTPNSAAVQYLIPGKGPNILISTPTTLINGAFQQFNSE